MASIFRKDSTIGNTEYLNKDLNKTNFYKRITLVVVGILFVTVAGVLFYNKYTKNRIKNPSTTIATEFEAKKRAQEFIAKYDLPADAEIYFDALTNKTTVIWRGGTNMDAFKQKFPQAFHKNDWLYCPVQKAKLEFIASQPIQLETVYFGRNSWARDFPNPSFLVQKGVVSCKENCLEIQINQVLNFQTDHQLYGW